MAAILADSDFFRNGRSIIGLPPELPALPRWLPGR
jgi:hypothetical protein